MLSGTTAHRRHCSVPPYRKDLSLDVDLVEEIVRVTGYETVPETLAPLATSDIPG